MNKKAQAKMREYSSLARKAIRDSERVRKTIDDVESNYIEAIGESLERIKDLGIKLDEPVEVGCFTNSFARYTIFIRQKGNDVRLVYKVNSPILSKEDQEEEHSFDLHGAVSLIYGSDENCTGFRDWYGFPLSEESLRQSLPFNVRILDGLGKILESKKK